MLAALLLNRMQNKRERLRKHKLKTLNNQSLNPVAEYCRTCLGKEDLVSIFYNRETSKKRTEDLKLVTGLEIKLNDGLSQKICTSCIETMNQALQFRLQSAKNDKKLRNLLHNERNIDMAGQKTNFKDYSYVTVNVNNDDLGTDMDETMFEECYLSLGEETQTDHDYLEVTTIMKQPPARRTSGDRPDKVYECEECGKRYNRKTAYRAHVNKHKNYRVCEECGQRCANNTLLVQHKRARHGCPRVHSCAACDYTSATKAGLTTHSRLHTDERPFACAHCAAAFHSRAGLVQHLPTHLAESNFECPICHKREKSKRLLQHHHHKVHRPKRHRYACPACPDVFKSPGSARHHLTASHGVRREDQPRIQRTEIQTLEAEDATLQSTQSFGKTVSFDQ